jgi:hypothetical protein
MNIDYEKWHDGIGYDLEALKEANNKERKAIERILVNRNPPDWRDIEALAILNTPGARSALKAAVLGGRNEVNMAVLRFAPELVNNELRTKLIVEALKSAIFYYGLRQTLDIVEKYHPKEVVREFFLKFNTENLSDRKIIFQELCKKINVDYREYLKCNQI